MHSLKILVFGFCLAVLQPLDANALSKQPPVAAKSEKTHSQREVGKTSVNSRDRKSAHQPRPMLVHHLTFSGGQCDADGNCTLPDGVVYWCQGTCTTSFDSISVIGQTTNNFVDLSVRGTNLGSNTAFKMVNTGSSDGFVVSYELGQTIDTFRVPPGVSYIVLPRAGQGGGFDSLAIGGTSPGATVTISGMYFNQGAVPPVFDLGLVEGSNGDAQIVATQSQGDPSISYEWTLVAPSGSNATIPASTTTNQVSIHRDVNGPYTISARGFNGIQHSSWVTQTFNYPDLQLTLASSPLNPTAGQPVTVTATTNSIDPTLTFTWTLDQFPGAPPILQQNGSMVTFVPNVQGMYLVHAHVGGLSGSADANLTLDVAEGCRSGEKNSPGAGCPGQGVTGEVHVGQVILDPYLGSANVIDIVDGKNGFAILRILKAGVPYKHLIVKNINAILGSRNKFVEQDETNDQGEIYIKFFPFMADKLDQVIPLDIYYDDAMGKPSKAKSLNVMLRKTVNLKLGFAKIDACALQSCYINVKDLQSDVDHSSAFIQAVYPVAENAIKGFSMGGFPGSVNEKGGELEDRKKLIKVGTNNDANFAVAVVSAAGPPPYGRGYFSYHLDSALGWGYFGDTAAFVTENLWEIAAHEIAHNLCVRYGTLAYCNPSEGGHVVPANNFVVGYNGNAPGFLSPPGLVSEKSAYMNEEAVQNSGSSDILTKIWSDRATYLSLFDRLLPINFLSRPSFSDIELKFGFSIDSRSGIHVDYVFAENSQAGTGEVGDSGMVVQLSRSDGSVSTTASARNISKVADSTAVSSPGEHFEVTLPLGLDDVKLTIRDSTKFFQPLLAISPTAELLRTNIEFMPDKAFNLDPAGSRDQLNSVLNSMSDSLLAGDFSSAQQNASSLSGLISSLTKADYSDSDVSATTPSGAKQSAAQAAVQIAIASNTGLNLRNSFIALTKVATKEKIMIGGRKILDTENHGSDLIVSAKVNDVPIDTKMNRDGTFSMLINAMPGEVLIQTYLRNHDRAAQLQEQIDELTRQLKNLKIEFNDETNPDTRLVLQRRIDTSVSAIGTTVKTLKDLAVSVGSSISFKI